MPIRESHAEWTGTLREGSGRMRVGADRTERPFTYRSRFEDGEGSNPEELLAAAHAGCFSMAFSGGLTRAGHPPKRIHTTAKVHLEPGTAGFDVKKIELVTEVEVEGIADADFQAAAENAKNGCPISKALKAVEITVSARRL